MSIKEQYRKARQNLLRRVSSWKKKGYELLIDLPDIPKKPSKKSIERLKKMQLPELVKKGKIVSRETGEIFTPYGYEVERREKRKDRHDKEQEARDMARRFHADNGTTFEESEDIEEQKIPELDSLEDAIMGSGITELINNWNYARERYGDSKLWNVIQNGENIVHGTKYAETFQDLLGLALKYKEDGNAYMANECAKGCMEILQSMGNIDDSGLFKGEALIPLTAEDMAKLSERMNYAP